MVLYHVFNIYAIRMSGVFMISLASILLRTGLMHRGWAYLTYILALVLFAEYRLFLLGDPDLPGMGAGGKCYCPGPKPSANSLVKYSGEV